jgi:hypothetical protein
MATPSITEAGIPYTSESESANGLYFFIYADCEKTVREQTRKRTVINK